MLTADMLEADEIRTNNYLFRRLFPILLAAMFCFMQTSSFAQEPVTEGTVCTGLSRSALCPSGSAALGAERWLPENTPIGTFTDGRFIPRFPACCELPRNDILSDRHRHVLKLCPSNHVVTGADWEGEAGMENGKKLYGFRCTEINTERYMLSEETAGAFWGSGVSDWTELHVFRKGQIPVSLRHLLGRLDKYSWSQSGCVGYPLGSFLVGKVSKRCRGLLYRQLLFRGLAGDPPEGTPVKILADCSEITSRFDSEARCLDKLSDPRAESANKSSENLK